MATVFFIWQKINFVSMKVASSAGSGAASDAAKKKSDPLTESKKRMCRIAMMVGLLQVANMVVAISTSSLLEDWTADSDQV
jgi:hypothetical protein